MSNARRDVGNETRTRVAKRRRKSKREQTYGGNKRAYGERENVKYEITSRGLLQVIGNVACFALRAAVDFLPPLSLDPVAKCPIRGQLNGPITRRVRAEKINFMPRYTVPPSRGMCFTWQSCHFRFPFPWNGTHTSPDYLADFFTWAPRFYPPGERKMKTVRTR